MAYMRARPGQALENFYRPGQALMRPGLPGPLGTLPVAPFGLFATAKASPIARAASAVVSRAGPEAADTISLQFYSTLQEG